MHTQRPVVVVGLGPTGETVANLLGLLGIEVVVVERETTICPFPRAGALDGEALRVFQYLGLLDRIRQTLTLGQRVEFVGARGDVLLSVQPQHYPYGRDTLAFFHQPTLSGILRAHLAEFPHVERRLGKEFVGIEQQDGGVRITVRDVKNGSESVIEACWLLACDGGNSLVRNALGIEHAGESYRRKWMVVDAELKGPPGDPHFTFICDPKRPGVSTYLAQNHYRWEWALLEGETENDFPDQVIRNLLSRRADTGEYTIRRVASYTYHSRIAERWKKGRALLLGDAAHLSPPFGGQGMSNGIRDAFNVAWKLASVIGGHAPAALMDTYESERRPQVRALNRVAVLAAGIVEARNPIIAVARDFVLRRLVKPLARGILSENRLMYPRVIRGGHTGRGRKAGRPIIQPPVSDAAGRQLWLDDALGRGWSIVGWMCDPRDHIDLAVRDSWPLDVHLVSAGPPGSGFQIQDTGGALAHWFGPAQRCAVIRPDRIVYGVVRPGYLAATLTSAISFK